MAMGITEAENLFHISGNYTVADVNKRYRELINENHPDKFTTTAEKEAAGKKMANINKANSVLKKAAKVHETDTNTSNTSPKTSASAAQSNRTGNTNTSTYTSSNGTSNVDWQKIWDDVLKNQQNRPSSAPTSSEWTSPQRPQSTFTNQSRWESREERRARYKSRIEQEGPSYVKGETLSDYMKRTSDWWSLLTTDEAKELLDMWKKHDETYQREAAQMADYNKRTANIWSHSYKVLVVVLAVILSFIVPGWFDDAVISSNVAWIFYIVAIVNCFTGFLTKPIRNFFLKFVKKPKNLVFFD